MWALQCLLATQRGWALFPSPSAGMNDVPHGTGSIPVLMQGAWGLGPACVWGGRWHFCYLFFNRSSLLLKAHPHHVPLRGETVAQCPAGKLGSAKLCSSGLPAAIGCQQYQLWMGWYQGICEHPITVCPSLQVQSFAPLLWGSRVGNVLGTTSAHRAVWKKALVHSLQTLQVS